MDFLGKDIFPNEEAIYKLDDGRYWNTALACFVDTLSVNKFCLKHGITIEDIPMNLIDQNGNPTVEGLIDNLRFYGFKLGELAPLEEVKEEKLKEFDKVMLDNDLKLIRSLSNKETTLVDYINEIQQENRELRSTVINSNSKDEINSINPKVINISAIVNED